MSSPLARNHVLQAASGNGFPTAAAGGSDLPISALSVVGILGAVGIVGFFVYGALNPPRPYAYESGRKQG